jgi:hypothetical protein
MDASCSTVGEALCTDTSRIGQSLKQTLDNRNALLYAYFSKQPKLSEGAKMQITQVIHNNQLLGFIEHDGKRYTAIVLGDEIICKNHDDATQAIYDAHEIK